MKRREFLQSSLLFSKMMVLEPEFPINVWVL